NRTPTTNKILGTPRRHEPRTPLARPGQGAASARTAGSGLRVVHGRLRHPRSERGEGAAGGVDLTWWRLSQVRERRLDPREYRGLSELREYTLCLAQMLKRGGADFPRLSER